MNGAGPFVLAAAAAALVTGAGQAGAAPQSVASGSASAEIVAQQLTLTQTHQLIFGLVKSINNGAGTVVIAPNSTATRSPFGGATTVGSGPCNSEWCEDETNPSNPDSASYWGPGVFTVTGAPGAAYQLVATNATAIAYWRTPANGREPALDVTNFTFHTKSSGYTSHTGTLDSTGKDTVRVGGTLQVIAGMKTASYRVDVPMTVQYN